MFSIYGSLFWGSVKAGRKGKMSHCQRYYTCQSGNVWMNLVNTSVQFCVILLYATPHEIFSWRNLESLVLECVIHLNESGIPLKIGIRNPLSSTDRESGIQYLESGIHSVESRIQDCLTSPGAIKKCDKEVSGKLPTYPSPKPALTLTYHLGQNVA